MIKLQFKPLFGVPIDESYEREYKILGNVMASSLLLSSLLKGEERVKISINEFNEETKVSHIYMAESMANGEIRRFQFKKKICTYNKQHFLYRYSHFKLGSTRLAQQIKFSKVCYGDKQQNYTLLTPRNNPITNTMQFDSSDLDRFIHSSEQIPSFATILCRFSKHSCIGCLIQSLPGLSKENLKEYWEKLLAINYLKNVLEANENSNLDADKLIKSLNEANLEMSIHRYPVDYFCRCNTKYFIEMLKLTNIELIMDMEKNSHNTLQCEICAKYHHLTYEDFEVLKASFKK